MEISFYLHGDSNGGFYDEAFFADDTDPAATFALCRRGEGGVELTNDATGASIIVDDLTDFVIEGLCLDGAAALLRGESHKFSGFLQTSGLVIDNDGKTASTSDRGLDLIEAPADEFAAAMLACAGRFADLLERVAKSDPNQQGTAETIRARISEISGV
ncbi:hypothetical protein [Sedimentitalea todarodis]|uniref:Uncharacterized protein n=1 Tax=Sedimentitalea todarodis TaxID=1631240 RepID=A0ABU3VMZ0_9RHOB|nr:hypothetical protein [Sedimentitalea todarodis]MDU9007049.1 hypothetical protein [Sedimentitalea todarodis]